MKFTAICGIAAAIASQANAFGTYIRCSAEQLTEENNGIDREEKATIGFFQADPVNGQESEKHGFGFFSGMEEAEDYSVRIYEDDLLEGMPCNFAQTVMHSLGTFEEQWNGMTCAALQIPFDLQLQGVDSINGHIAALVNEEGLITSCCKLHDGSGDRRLAPAKEVEGQVEKADEEDDEKRRLDDDRRLASRDAEGQANDQEREDDGGERRLESWEYDPQLDKEEREDDGGDRRLRGCLVPGACVETAFDATNGDGGRRLQDEGRIDKVDLDDDEFGGHRRLQDEGRIDKVDLEDDEFGGHRLLNNEISKKKQKELAEKKAKDLKQKQKAEIDAKKKQAEIDAKLQAERDALKQALIDAEKKEEQVDDDVNQQVNHQNHNCVAFGISCVHEADDATDSSGKRRLARDIEGEIENDEGDDVDINEEEDGGRLLQALMFEEFGIPDGF